MLIGAIPPKWREAISPFWDLTKIEELESFLEKEWSSETIYPPREQLFTALELTPPEKVKVLLIGQDPYHGEGQAHGLAFSVNNGVRVPPSLRNIFKELNSDLGYQIPDDGNLTTWADSGVLLLNSVLTVRAGEAASHRDCGWEFLTDAILKAVNAANNPVIFILWGVFAQNKEKYIDKSRHRVVSSVHPSPLSAHRGFLGSRPFSRANELLMEIGRTPIDWQLPIKQQELF